MASQTRRRLWRSTLVAALVGTAGLVALAVSAAWASIPDSSQTIHACYTNVGGILRVIDTDRGQTCKRWETPLDWSAAPPAGPGALPDSYVVNLQGGIQVADQDSPVLELNLPPGKYQVTGKVQISNGGFESRKVGCSLTPANEDGSPGDIGSQPGEDGAALHVARFDDPGETGELTLFVSQTLASAGVVQLSCGTNVAEPTSVFASAASIRAIEVGSINGSSEPAPLP
jgi:hypothetical protein